MTPERLIDLKYRKSQLNGIENELLEEVERLQRELEQAKGRERQLRVVLTYELEHMPTNWYEGNQQKTRLKATLTVPPAKEDPHENCGGSQACNLAVPPKEQR